MAVDEINNFLVVQYAPPIFQHTATVWQAILALSLLLTLWMK